MLNACTVSFHTAGAGGGGINTTSSIITSDLFPLKQRGLVNSASGVVWAVSAPQLRRRPGSSPD